MAFGRSNSLSINTGNANSGTSLFGNNTTNSTTAAGSLFGGAATNASQAQPSGSMFGNAQSDNATGGGLFGSTANNNQAPGGGLFGGASNTTLFGNNANQNAGGGGLFGNNNTSNQAGNGGLFGNANNNISNQTAAGSLFGNNNNTGSSGGLFGAGASSTNQIGSGKAEGNSFFGNSNNTSSLFSANNANANRNGTIGGFSMFGSNQNQQQNQAQNQNTNTASAFGMTAVPVDQLNRSLLGVSQFRQLQAIPGSFVGRLSMGQGAATPAQNTATVGGTKVTLDELRSTTRFQDLHDDLKMEFERADKMIQAQETFCAQVQAKLQRQGEDVASISPDVILIGEQLDAVEQCLASDAQGVDVSRRTTDKDNKDFERCRRVITNLTLPDRRFHVSSSGYGNQHVGHASVSTTEAGSEDNYDTDIIANYFTPLSAELQRVLESYAVNLREIEGHMRVIESSAISQAQYLAASRAGITTSDRRQNQDATVRDLAETLQGFEQSILGVAGTVGQCREGVNQLVLGQLDGSVGQDSNRSRGVW